MIGRDGGYGLLVKARKKKTGPIDLSFGFGYSSADESDFNLLLSLRMKELNSLGGEWRNYLSAGNTTRIVSEWYQPIDWERRFFFAAQGLFGTDYIDGRGSNGDPLRFRQQDHAAEHDLGARLWQAGELRIGHARGFSNSATASVQRRTCPQARTGVGCTRI